MSRYPLEEVLLPMGATHIKDESRLEKIMESKEYITEEKYDGSRYICIGGRFFSRKLSTKDKLPVEKTDNVPHLVEVFKRFPKLVIDGEIYSKNGKSNDVVSIMGSLPERAISLQLERGLLDYVVFDVLFDVDGNDMRNKPLYERKQYLTCFMKHILSDTTDSRTYHVKLASVYRTDAKNVLKDILGNGGEGIILKNLNSKYVCGKKPVGSWVKIKQSITSDVVITGFINPVKEYTGKDWKLHKYWYKDGNFLETHIFQKQLKETGYEPITRFFYYDFIGAIEFSQYDSEGNLVKVGQCSGMDDATRKELSINKDKYLGTCIEISAMERTKDMMFRHPQFLRLRPDKNPEECVIGVD